MQYLHNRKTQHHQGDRNGNREKTRPIRPYPSEYPCLQGAPIRMQLAPMTG